MLVLTFKNLHSIGPGYLKLFVICLFLIQSVYPTRSNRWACYGFQASFGIGPFLLWCPHCGIFSPPQSGAFEGHQDLVMTASLRTQEIGELLR